MDDPSQVFAAVRRAGGEDAELHPLADITNKEIEEVKHLKHPPREVARVMEVVHLLLTQPTSLACDWNDVLRTVVRIDFLKRARSINLDGVLQQAKLIDYVCRKYFAGEEPLTPDRVRWASKAVVAFFGWTVAIIAGVLPEFPTKVAGEEARRRIQLLDQELRENRRRESEERKAAELRQETRKRAEEEQKEELARLELARLEQQRVEEAKRIVQEQQAKEAAAVARREVRRAEEAEAKRIEALEHQGLDAQARLERQEAAERARKAKKAAAKEAKMMRKKRRMLALDSDESGSEAERERGTWNSNNPDIRFLSIQGEHVTFVSDQFADHCVALTCRPIFYGRHFYEFHIRHFSDQLRVGVTTDAVQAGALVAGHNLRGWCYYSGRMDASRKALKAGLQINNKVVQDFSFMAKGDAIGVIVDADRWSVAFLRNRVLEGSCAMASPTREPLFLLVHLDAAADHVELRKVSLEEAPANALEQLDSFVPPSWSVLVSDCSSVESEAAPSTCRTSGEQQSTWASAVDMEPSLAPKSSALRQPRPPTQPTQPTQPGQPSKPTQPGLGSKRSQGQGGQGLPKAESRGHSISSTLSTSKSSSTLEKMQKRPSSSSLLAAGAVLSRPQSAEKAKSESPKKTHRQEKQQCQLSSRTSQSFGEMFSKPQLTHPVESPQHPQSPAAGSTVSLKARLRELKECLDEGLLTPEEFQEEKAIVLKAMRPGAGAAGAAGAAPALPASQPQLPPVAAVAAVAAVEPSPAPTVSTVSAVSAVSAVPAIPAIPASLLGTSFSMPWVQREFTTHQAEGWGDESSMPFPDVKGRGFTALLDNCAAAFDEKELPSRYKRNRHVTCLSQYVMVCHHVDLCSSHVASSHWKGVKVGLTEDNRSTQMQTATASKVSKTHRLVTTT
ncbi:unnamed protein product [Cladocopium goreaui]|uniref:Reticulocyte-binding protein 2-like a n=1 Tax=Cladocopium goreaui TaxID=2562237 RepID=A0A9P1BQ69_9DINO|nr:unnamed protein product [Cladocopium goreaui]